MGVIQSKIKPNSNNNNTKKTNIRTIDKNKKIIIYCPSCNSKIIITDINDNIETDYNSLNICSKCKNF